VVPPADIVEKLGGDSRRMPIVVDDVVLMSPEPEWRFPRMAACQEGNAVSRVVIDDAVGG
jgi:hypothetical protein